MDKIYLVIKILPVGGYLIVAAFNSEEKAEDYTKDTDNFRIKELNVL